MPPRWFSAWNRYAAWLKYAMTATPYADVRLSFDSPFTGYDLSEPKHRTSRVVILIGEDFKAMVSREFRRIVYTGTMGWRQQIVRPAREVALGIWLATLGRGNERAWSGLVH